MGTKLGRLENTVQEQERLTRELKQKLKRAYFQRDFIKALKAVADPEHIILFSTAGGSVSAETLLKHLEDEGWGSWLESDPVPELD